MAVRRGPYKMHLWTWNTSQKELDQVRKKIHTIHQAQWFYLLHVLLTGYQQFVVALFSCNSTSQGTDFCPGQRQDNVTTTIPIDHSQNPILYDVVADPAERYQIHNSTNTYKTIVKQVIHKK